MKILHKIYYFPVSLTMQKTIHKYDKNMRSFYLAVRCKKLSNFRMINSTKSFATFRRQSFFILINS